VSSLKQRVNFHCKRYSPLLNLWGANETRHEEFHDRSYHHPVDRGCFVLARGVGHLRGYERAGGDEHHALAEGIQNQTETGAKSAQARKNSRTDSQGAAAECQLNADITIGTANGR
jgi:hypothetical protein